MEKIAFKIEVQQMKQNVVFFRILGENIVRVEILKWINASVRVPRIPGVFPGHHLAALGLITAIIRSELPCSFPCFDNLANTNQPFRTFPTLCKRIDKPE